MAESVTNSDVPSVKPPPKRRRILDPSAIVPVPVYSSKVSSSLQLKPMAPVFTETETKGDDADDISSWSQFSSRGTSTTPPPPPVVVGLSDSDDDEVEQKRAEPDKVDAVRCPSPPPPESPVQKQSRHVKRKISEIDRRLRAVNSLLSPEHQDRTGSRRLRGGGGDDDDDDDDVIIMTPGPGSRSSSYSSSTREIPLKIRCRADIHKIPVLPSTPLGDVLAQLSVTLEVPPPRLLLLREDVELQTDATVGELGLGIADIIECVVMAAEEKNTGGGGGASDDIITVRLQSKDRDSSQEFSLHRDAPLGSVFSQYLSRLSPRSRGRVRFHFDGSKVSERQTPAELDMEDGDIVEVWT